MKKPKRHNFKHHFAYAQSGDIAPAIKQEKRINQEPPSGAVSHATTVKKDLLTIMIIDVLLLTAFAALYFISSKTGLVQTIAKFIEF